MSQNSQKLDHENPWPHRAALVLVCATFPLIWVGGLVTTTHAGMAVPDWPNTYGYNLFLYPWQTWLFGPWDLFIEHGHRLFGAIVGMLTIIFAICVWRFDDRRWMKILAAVAIPAVIGQGVLGGMRVLLDARTLAKIHGCTGAAFFALTVALSVFTSRSWRCRELPIARKRADVLHRVAFLTCGLAFFQLVLGAQVRHIAVTATPGLFQTSIAFHLGMAVVLVAHVVWLSAIVMRHGRDALLVRPASLLAGLTLIQLGLGAATWIVKYGWPVWFAGRDWFIGRDWAASYIVTAGSLTQSHVVTSHVAIGSLIFVVALVVALRSVRLFRPEPQPKSVHFRSFLGVAA